MQQFEDSTIRRFVLGDLDEETRQQLEVEAMADDEVFGRIEAVEDEIIEEYLAGTLPRSERKIFDETLDTTPGRRRRVELVKTLAARKPRASKPSNVVSLSERMRFASHARLSIAAGFAAAAITALIFVQSRKSATDDAPPAPTVALSPAPVSATPSIYSPVTPAPSTSSALAARQPGAPMLAPSPSAVGNVAATSVATFLLTTGTARSGDDGRTFDLAAGVSEVDLQIAVDDDEFSHYNAELRAPDGTSVASARDLPVTAQKGAPVITVRVPASALRSGRHELVLAGVHERGAEEVAYIEFDVRRR
ncbi:MAG: hypothetical protein NDJ92_02865 [Thermoanaerobaculia bacterium]|nr:hypothetical protein [Thermoanaerobaculia bacterium]